MKKIGALTFGCYLVKSKWSRGQREVGGGMAGKEATEKKQEENTSAHEPI